MSGMTKRTGLSNLDKVKDLYDIKDSELGESLGYGKATVSTWRKAGAMPAVAGLACECLLRRKGNGKDAASIKLDTVRNLILILIKDTSDPVQIKLLEAAEIITTI